MVVGSADMNSWRLMAPTNDLSLALGRLRPWLAADAAALCAAWADTEIARWNTPPTNPSEAMALRWIEGAHARLADGTALDLVVDVDGSVAGEVGISGVDVARRAGLIGYWVAPGHRRKGIAVAAVHVVAEWAVEDGGFQLIVARCDPANVASQLTAARAGFVHEMTEATGTQLWVRRANESI